MKGKSKEDKRIFMRKLKLMMMKIKGFLYMIIYQMRTSKLSQVKMPIIQLGLFLDFELLLD